MDDPTTLRMYVFKDAERGPENNHPVRYHGRPMNVREREKLMGYPVGYVEKPGMNISVDLLAFHRSRLTSCCTAIVSDLFRALLSKGLQFQRRDQSRWQDVLPEKYHHFAGHYHGVMEVAGGNRRGESEDSHKVSLIGSKVIPEKGGFPNLGEDGAGAVQYMDLLMAPPLGGTKEPSYFDATSYVSNRGCCRELPLVSSHSRSTDQHVNNVVGEASHWKRMYRPIR